MFASGLVTLLIGISLSLVDCAPVKTGVKLNPEATAEAHPRDNAATRAFTATEIKTSDGQCFSVDPTSGDFRANLTPVQIKRCDGSPGQKWDVITAGKHNDQPRFALIVSSLTNACLNFDPRREAGNQVMLFSCGGRANGEGVVTESQLFPFNNGQTSLPLKPKVGNDNICLTPIDSEGVLDQTTCSDANNQVFTFGSGPVEGSGGRPTASPSPAVVATATPSNSSIPGTSILGVKTGVKLDPDAVAEAHQRDNTATRAFTGSVVKTLDGKCLFVDPTSGDFRQNLTPVQVKSCDGSDGQKWDIITSGKHNDQPGFALMVSSLTNACINFDDRRKVSEQVFLFSCGGRADGSGEVQDAQLFPFESGQTTIVLQPKKGKNDCLVPSGELLDRAACSGGGDQTFTIGGGETSSVVSSPAASSSTVSSTPPSTATPPPVSTQSAPGVKSGVELDETAVAEAHQRDNDATRAFTGATIKASDGQCLFVDPTSGDFRMNLTPVQIRPCDGSDGQKWDLITAGKHNDRPGFALIVSSLTSACLNFDPRREPRNRVLLFSCGGRADGSGEVQVAQLFPFEDGQTTLPLLPQNANDKVCLAAVEGLLDHTACSGAASAKGNQIFTIS